MLKVHTRRLGNVAVVGLQGRIVSGDTASLREEVFAQSHVSEVVLDLALVTAVDAVGLGIMLELRQHTEAKGIGLRLMNVSRIVREVLEITQLDSVFEIIPNVEPMAALATLTFQSNPKHRGKKHGRISAQPTDGQAALNNSIQISERSSRRVGVDQANKEFVVFMEHLPEVFHGFVVEWNDLERNVQRLLQKLGLVTGRGRILSEIDEIRTTRSNR